MANSSQHSLNDYRQLLDETEKWFRSICVRFPDQMQCARGCSRCCYGLFDVSLPDAIIILEGMKGLSEVTQTGIIERAAEIQRSIMNAAPTLESPFFLNTLSEEQIYHIVDLVQEPRCPLLGQHNQCLIYDCRPLACRIKGAPMTDVEDGPFDDWCKLNFTRGIPFQAAVELERDYGRMQQIEIDSTLLLSKQLLGHSHNRVTIFIPSLVIELKGWWHKFLDNRKNR
jgi:Fe-S-cluster containining protein